MNKYKDIIAQYDQTLLELQDYPTIHQFLLDNRDQVHSKQLKGSQLTSFREKLLSLTDGNPKAYPSSLAKLISLIYIQEITSGVGIHSL
ncbi:hypothetical protein JOC36_001158 [Weissella uvarum]|uniref:hypothetical protein n=1 Tax=Weissella uvarum TaxID=1479233 RepID=UPI00195F9AE7|nr:hypothetical protein [Weissella uvarum]MBM7617596.1 hypothetical protein [Weissella uvarum]MCM0595947.1 hypothetical protein [Weissella uvarum]